MIWFDLNVVATVCDQGANNQAAINMLVKETEQNYKRRDKELYEYYFQIDERKIFPLFDVPHLFKGLRNNLLKYNLNFVENGTGKLAKWADIYTAFQMDPYLGSLRLMPKITEAHVNLRENKQNEGVKMHASVQPFCSCRYKCICFFRYVEIKYCKKKIK